MNDGAAGVALLGLGTIGTGVARLLTAEPTRIARRAGRPVRIVGALVRDAGRPRGPFAQDVPVTTDARRLIEDERVSLVVEALGGTEPSRTLVLEALAAGKDVVTANKALLAEHGVEIFGEARRLGRALAFEGSVAGGVPIVQALGVGLAANEILSISAIVNGTCNFILTSMTRDGVGYADALAEAQRLGYAEPDPTFDVDGTDAAHKLAILAQLGFGANVAMSSIPRTGIDGVPAADLRYAGEL
ncbi:MAG: homoserine dehydrogenase, partial [Planctomycetota bacterium]|nr:homoserine dehydrogenase [Planctomycetota bacterium]